MARDAWLKVGEELARGRFLVLDRAIVVSLDAGPAIDVAKARAGGEIRVVPVSIGAGTQSRVPSVDTVSTWPSRWCQAEIGMNRSQMTALMRPPTEESDLATGNPQMSWSALEYQFNAFLDLHDRDRQLDVNDVQLTAAEKAAIRCETTRAAR